jgi:hypothetical protein
MSVSETIRSELDERENWQEVILDREQAVALLIEIDYLRDLNAEKVNVIRELMENGSWSEIPSPLRARLRKAAKA